MNSVVFFSCADSKRQDILPGRYGTGGIMGEGTGRIVGLVKIDRGFAIFRRLFNLEEPAGRVGGLAAGLVGENDEKLIPSFIQCVE